ncbi:hypothetical protein BXZ70DRAFT_1052435 [Cristinia sonorae]|uniref:Thioredoxin domain-containing protein n=1 Tax=Cristinia sonorae TaxID=1940300 RepID=A0A8K0UTZ7_9AGAR|nr:hypothetical protein BXZ70DRAFT_1052435 [Cristinia sonorae]
MLLSDLILVSLALAPSMVSAALFPKNTQVKFLDPKGFKKVMKQNVTSAVAFVAPWCGHCQKMAPDWSNAALGLYPLVPFYAVDCDKQSNKNLCAQQGVQGFPTLKLYPRGGQVPPLSYDSAERSASGFYYWASRNIPHGVKKIYYVEDIAPWVEEHKTETRALLLNNGKHIPLLWQVLGNKYKDFFTFAIHRDRHGKSSIAMGLESQEFGQSKVLIYPPGKTDFVVYEGISKHDSLTKFFDSIIDGTANLEIANKQAAVEEFEPTEEELEIERQQEAQRIALAHGGYSDLIDFEEAIKQHGKDFHGKHGFPGSMGDMPRKKVPSPEQEKDEIMKKIVKSQAEEAARSTETAPMVKTGDGAQVVFEPATESGHPSTPAAVPRAEPTPAPEAASSSDAVPTTEAVETPAEVPAASTTPAVDEAEPAVVEAEPAAEEETVAAKSAPTATAEAGEVPEGHVKDEL